MRAEDDRRDASSDTRAPKHGRPTTISEAATKIIAALSNGADRASAAGYAGVPYGTLRSWLSRGRNGHEPFASFVRDFEAAEAEAAVRMAKVIFDAAHENNDFRAALEWLRRRRPAEWADPKGEAQASAQAYSATVRRARSPSSQTTSSPSSKANWQEATMNSGLPQADKERLLTAVRIEQTRRACSRSFRAFLPFWHFVNRESGEICTFQQLWPGQEAFAELMETERFILALKAGKLGFTELGCAYDAWVALFGPANSRAHLFSRDERAAQELLSYVRFGLTRLPDWLRPSFLEDEPGGDSARGIKFRLGPDDVRVVASYPAAPHVSIDQTCQHAHLDELARMPFPDKTWPAVYSTIAPSGSCHVITRGAGDDNFAATLWETAAAGTSVLYPFFQPWTARPDRDDEWYGRQEGTLALQALKHLAPESPEDALAGSEMNEFIPIELWDRCREDLPPFLPEDQEPVVLGVDAAVTGDCFAIVAVTRHPSRHNDVAVRALKKWNPPRGGRIDFSEPEDFIRTVCLGGCGLGHPTPRPGCPACESSIRYRGYNVVQITYDAYQLESLMGTLRKEGWAWCEEFPQTRLRLIADSQLHDLIVNRRIAHDGDPRLREHFQNAAAELSLRDDSRIRIRKKAPARKVDLVVALSMAAYQCLYLLL